MKQLPLHSRITKPPKAVQRARMDNISLVPASLLLAEKDKYQTITNNLPRGSVLICETPRQPRIARILSQVAAFLREKGHVVRILPYSVMVQSYDTDPCEKGPFVLFLPVLLWDH